MGLICCAYLFSAGTRHGTDSWQFVNSFEVRRPAASVSELTSHRLKEPGDHIFYGVLSFSSLTLLGFFVTFGAWPNEAVHLVNACSSQPFTFVEASFGALGAFELNAQKFHFTEHHMELSSAAA